MKIFKTILIILSIILCYPFTQGKAEEKKQAMTFLDVIQMQYPWEPDISPDGKWFVYTISVADWEKNKRFSDIYITPLSGGKTKQITFTKDKNESSLKWYKDSSFFAFLSDRSGNKNQIYFMRPDSGEAWQVTDDKYGISSYEWSLDGKYLSYPGVKPGGRQIWIMPSEGGEAEKLTDHKTPISSYLWSPNSKKIYFIAPDSVDLLDKERKEKGFNVVIKDEIKIPSHLWEIDIETKEEKRLTGGNEYSVSQIVISDDGTKLAFIGKSIKRYATGLEAEVYLLDLNTNTISRITNNSVDEGSLSFSPDSKWFAFAIPHGEAYMNFNKIHVVPTEGGKTKKLLNNFDNESWLNFWSDDSRYIYFRAQVGVNWHLFRVSIDNDQIEQLTNFGGSTAFIKDKDSGKFFVSYLDPENPWDSYYSEPENFNNRDKWIKLTDSNPQVKEFLLGKYETISWKSTDSTTIEGLLIKPVNYREGIKYPLIVQIHGGPASAYYNIFDAHVHIFSANDYVVFQPNYRGSRGYGEKFKKEIAGDYFRLSFDDIMTGVDYLIERGIVHPDSMGIMGWSAGGMLANWALISTDRFKAISTGAGAVNWISCYGQSGGGEFREFYLKGTPYDNWDHYVEESPLKYIKNAKTPTLIHSGENDRNVPISQGQELYTALKKLGVPTEFIVYPNTGHAITDMRYRMVKMQAEFNWFEKWIRGKEGWIDWKEMIETLKNMKSVSGLDIGHKQERPKGEDAGKDTERTSIFGLGIATLLTFGLGLLGIWFTGIPLTGSERGLFIPASILSLYGLPFLGTFLTSLFIAPFISLKGKKDAPELKKILNKSSLFKKATDNGYEVRYEDYTGWKIWKRFSIARVDHNAKIVYLNKRWIVESDWAFINLLRKLILPIILAHEGIHFSQWQIATLKHLTPFIRVLNEIPAYSIMPISFLKKWLSLFYLDFLGFIDATLSARDLRKYPYTLLDGIKRGMVQEGMTEEEFLNELQAVKSKSKYEKEIEVVRASRNSDSEALKRLFRAGVRALMPFIIVGGITLGSIINNSYGQSLPKTSQSETQKRAMTFLDIIQMRYSMELPDISPDGKWFIYTLTVRDWEKTDSFSDIYITPIGGKTKQMTFTKDKDENSPEWYKDSSFFAFLSNRSEDKNQIFFMRPDGGEAWQVTDDKFGVSSYQWSRDGKYLAYTAGKPEERQIWIMSGEGGEAEKLTDHKTPISSHLWNIWNPNSKKIYFLAPDSVDLLDKERKGKGFNVVIKDEIKIPSHLWEIDIETKEEKRLTGENEYSVSQIVISDDGTKIAFIGKSTKRYATGFEREVYLLDLNTNTISRITNNSVGERSLRFSPDSKWFAFAIPHGEKELLNLRKIYVIPTEGGETKKLLKNFDYEGGISFWSNDSRYIYFTSQVGLNYPLFKVSIDNDQIEQITNLAGGTYFYKDKDSGKFIVWYSDSENPEDCYYSEPENLAHRDKWIRLTDANPQVKDFLLGKYETIRWKSTDGTIVEGILIKPVNYKEGRRYPLIVQIHGGPASAYTNSFEASWGNYVHIFAANDYVVFQPNYRGSSGYGEKFKKEIVGNFHRLSFDDIMTGVDYLIERGIVNPDSMGIMGWSAGGDFSNWALVLTDRFKAISTGAGTVNQISYYGQTDMQSWVELYFKGTPYNNWDDYVEESPLKYIKNAKTPTLIHFGENDRRVPISQGQELYIALKKLGVPTEFIVYPNVGHGISDMRYRMVKMQAEFNWFEKWIRDKEGWIDWKEMIETLEKEKKE